MLARVRPRAQQRGAGIRTRTARRECRHGARSQRPRARGRCDARGADRGADPTPQADRRQVPETAALPDRMQIFGGVQPGEPRTARSRPSSSPRRRVAAGNDTPVRAARRSRSSGRAFGAAAPPQGQPAPFAGRWTRAVAAVTEGDCHAAKPCWPRRPPEGRAEAPRARAREGRSDAAHRGEAAPPTCAPRGAGRDGSAARWSPRSSASARRPRRLRVQESFTEQWGGCTGARRARRRRWSTSPTAPSPRSGRRPAQTSTSS